MNSYNTEFERWLNSDKLNSEERKYLESIANDEDAKIMAFSSPIGFGTAGLRSTMSCGIATMNRFTVAQTSRGIAALILSSGGKDRGVVIAFDSRNNSREFAQVSASVFAGAGIKVYVFDDLRPTPELSFAVKQLGAMAGVNITASHNPKEYNGYKAYWEDGAQISPEQAKIVSAERNKFDILDDSGIISYEDGVRSGIITELGEDFDEIYLNAVIKTAIDPSVISEVADSLKVVYTPLHGAGAKLVPEVFKRVGLKQLYTVEEQMKPDGNFPTVKKPNPEYADVFSLGIAIADRVGSDIVIATDPDSDRVGVMTRTKNNEFITISGNQMGALLLDYVISRRRAIGTMPKAPYCVKSIVSTDMVYKIAEMNGVKLHDVLTGFKYIGEVIKNYERESQEDGFLLGFEESYGYLMGTYARDKDAVEASMMILEMTAYYKKQGMTLSDALNSLYEKYGCYMEGMIDLYMEGVNGIENRKRVMARLREEPPKTLGGYSVVKIGDYSMGTFTNVMDGSTTPTGQPSSDVLYYVLENDDKIIVRPSGTEPKIKIYILSHDSDMDSVNEKIKRYAQDARRITEA